MPHAILNSVSLCHYYPMSPAYLPCCHRCHKSWSEQETFHSNSQFYSIQPNEHTVADCWISSTTVNALHFESTDPTQTVWHRNFSFWIALISHFEHFRGAVDQKCQWTLYANLKPRIKSKFVELPDCKTYISLVFTSSKTVSKSLIITQISAVPLR